MNILLYYNKNNFDTQKVRRFLKERRVPFTEVELAKHRLGARELKLFAQAAGGMKALLDPGAKGERADYVRQLSIDEYIADELMQHSGLIRSPIVRNGNRLLFGFDEKGLNAWLDAGE